MECGPAGQSLPIGHASVQHHFRRVRAAAQHRDEFAPLLVRRADIARVVRQKQREGVRGLPPYRLGRLLRHDRYEELAETADRLRVDAPFR